MENTNTQNQLFPVFLKLKGKTVLIVGGGRIALEKLRTVLRNSPDAWIYVVAPEVSEEIKSVASENQAVFIWNETFQPHHLNDIDLVITATGIRQVAEDVKHIAEEKRIWVNTADIPDLCDFYLGGVVIKGPLKIAVSTNGKSPVMARRLREVLEEAIPDEAAISIEQLHELRKFLKGDFTNRVKELNHATRLLVKRKTRKPRLHRIKQWISGASATGNTHI
ncbi:MAG: bifunctional precorrin-2 dehydrogenase/sirohydrochlorin ferrochelatase [Flavobacteriales bacterium]